MTVPWYKVILSAICVLSLCDQYFVAAQTEDFPAGAGGGDELVHRMKRFLIFNNGGLVKVVHLQFRFSPGALFEAVVCN